MSKFKVKVKNCVTVNIPESFRKDLQDLCNEIEVCDDFIVLNDIIGLILDANPKASHWSNFDESLIINFIKEE